MKILITGKNGQLGWELVNRAPANDVEVYAFDSGELDITDSLSVQDKFTMVQPDVVINTAAYTAVDKAESDNEGAFLVNEQGAINLAQACKKFNARLLHVSTDFVFDGTKHSNFVKTMLRLMQEKPQLGVVSNQIGTPTYAAGLADWLWRVSDNNHVKGLYHWTDAGVASWYDFAVAIQELALEKGILKNEIPVRPIYAEQYPTPAKRPAFSVIDKTSAEKDSGLQTTHWRKQLSVMLDKLAK